MHVSLLFYHKCCTPQARSAELMSAILYNFMVDLQILRALGDLDGISDGSGPKPGPGPARSPGFLESPWLDFWQRAKARARLGPLLKSPGALKGF